MQLNYEIDILPPRRDRRVSHPRLGWAQDASAGLYLAAFRDPKTAAAARAADPRITSILQDAGVALDSYSSEVPEGHYPQRDLQAREYVMACLMDAMQDEDEVPTDDFDLSEVVVQLSKSQPFGALVPMEHGEDTVEEKRKAFVAMGIFALSGYVAGFGLLI
ncbi:MAG: hypothetical protein AAFZ02_03745 [Pseudomonadota bacterium]